MIQILDKKTCKTCLFLDFGTINEFYLLYLLTMKNFGEGDVQNFRSHCNVHSS